MYKDNQERIDSYLRGEMDKKSRIEFVKDLESDNALKKEYQSTKTISDAIADRKEKLDMMARWNKEEEIRRRLISRRKNICRWTIGMSAAACVGLFAIRPMLLTTSPVSDVSIPNFSNEFYYRGSDNSMEFMDSLITACDYEKAIVYADSLISEYNNELKHYKAIDSLTEKQMYNKELCEERLEDLEWRRANLFVTLGKTSEAKILLKRIVNGNGYYREQADTLLNMIK